MKKIIIVLILFLTPITAGAYFNNSLYYGLQNNSEVKELQEFLTDQGVYSGPITGNFYSLTLAGVKTFQQKENISPVAGYFGILTRTRANDLLSDIIEPSDQQAIQETGSIPLIPEPEKTINDVVKSLQDQITLLLQQITALQEQQITAQQLQQTVEKQAQTIQEIQENTQKIVENTTPAPPPVIIKPEIPIFKFTPTVFIDDAFYLDVTIEEGFDSVSVSEKGSGAFFRSSLFS